MLLMVVMKELFPILHYPPAEGCQHKDSPTLLKETEGRRGTPESWMAYFLSARVASELAGVEGPVSLEQYRRLMEAKRQQELAVSPE